MRTGTFARGIALSGAALLVLTACGGGDDEPAGGTGGGGGGGGDEKLVKVYGSDGNMGNALGEDFTEEGALAGMKGTTPLTELSGDFKDRLLETDPKLQDFNYAGESYDAVVITALAAQMAGTNDANVFKAYINGVTTGGDKCETFKACLDIVNAGGNPDYDGVSGPLGFTDPGEPAVGSYGVLQFGPDNKLEEDVEYIIAGDEANASKNEGPPPVAPGATGEQLVIGYLLPETGNLAYLGPPEIAGFNLAIKDVNDAGGVLGQPVRAEGGDSGDTSTDTATQTVDRLL